MYQELDSPKQQEHVFDPTKHLKHPWFPVAKTTIEASGARRCLGRSGGFGMPIAAVECDIANIPAGLRMAWRDIGYAYLLMQWVPPTSEEPQGKWIEVPLIRVVPEAETS